MWLLLMEPSKTPNIVSQLSMVDENDDEIQRLLPLFRLLMREPPEGHDFATCPVCKRHGIIGLEA
jgi:hypothetical protein